MENNKNIILPRNERAKIALTSDTAIALEKLSNTQKENYINDYLNTYVDKSGTQNYYTDAYRDWIRKGLYHEFGTDFRDHMTQIYYALGLLKDQDNVYDQLAEMIVKTYGKDARYLEICGGVYPALAHALSKQLTTGEIITYDGALSRAPEAQLKQAGMAYNKYYYSYQRAEGFDVLIGKEPCAATDDLIRLANYNNKDIILTPCTCDDLLYDHALDTEQEWIDYVYNDMTNRGTDQVDISYLSTPIYTNPIYTKKR